MAAHTDKKYGIKKKATNKSYNTLFILNVLGVYFEVTESQKKIIYNFYDEISNIKRINLTLYKFIPCLLYNPTF